MAESTVEITAVDIAGNASDALLRGTESKPMNWKKIFEDNTHNTKGIYDAIVKDEKERKPKGGSTGDAASGAVRDSTGKSSRSRKQVTGVRGGKARSTKGKAAPTTTSSALSTVEVNGQMMYMPPVPTATSQAAVPVPELLLDSEEALHDDSFPDFGFDFSDSNGYL